MWHVENNLSQTQTLEVVVALDCILQCLWLDNFDKIPKKV